MVLAETFDHVIFRQSLARMFERDADGHLSMAFNATVEASQVRTTAGFAEAR